MKAGDLLARMRQLAFWSSLGFRSDELTVWGGGLLPKPISEERWEAVMAPHALQVQADLDPLPGPRPIAPEPEIAAGPVANIKPRSHRENLRPEQWQP